MELLEKRKILEETCDKHGCQLWEFPYPNRDTGQTEISRFCPECTSEAIALTQEEMLKTARNATEYVKTYDVLMRDSTVPKELRGASFDNFIADTTEEKQLLEFAKGQSIKYINGMTGNTLITGQTGIGKSHLTFAMAKSINEHFKEIGKPKSVLFVNLTEIIKEIKQGWNYGRMAKLTEHEAVKMMARVDFLFIDDLGAKNTDIKPKSDWEQDFLFDILNQRETTIFNTNLDSGEIKSLYNARNASRIFKGLDGNTFKAFSIKDKRFSINNYKKGE
ncbi:TPA: ATP-binding protein [Streptococcus suis]|nr:ATP-binding protein [Streptococcus suis]